MYVDDLTTTVRHHPVWSLEILHQVRQCLKCLLCKFIFFKWNARYPQMKSSEFWVWHIGAWTKWPPFADIFKCIVFKKIFEYNLFRCHRSPFLNAPFTSQHWLIKVMAWRRMADNPLQELLRIQFICSLARIWIEVNFIHWHFSLTWINLNSSLDM